jgi:hypothetical protein
MGSSTSFNYITRAAERGSHLLARKRNQKGYYGQVLKLMAKPCCFLSMELQIGTATTLSACNHLCCLSCLHHHLSGPACHRCLTLNSSCHLVFLLVFCLLSADEWRREFQWRCTGVQNTWGERQKHVRDMRQGFPRWYVSNVSIIFDAPCLFLHHLLSVLLHFMALLCIFRN